MNGACQPTSSIRRVVGFQARTVSFATSNVYTQAFLPPAILVFVLWHAVQDIRQDLPRSGRRRLAVRDSVLSSPGANSSSSRPDGNGRFREGFRMPARRERSTRVRGPACESPRRRNPRDSGGWPMGIWRGSGFGEGWFSQDRREMKAADDCALAAAAVLDGVIEDQPVRPCRRLQAPG